MHYCKLICLKLETNLLKTVRIKPSLSLLKPILRQFIKIYKYRTRLYYKLNINDFIDKCIGVGFSTITHRYGKASN